MTGFSYEGIMTGKNKWVGVDFAPLKDAKSRIFCRPEAGYFMALGPNAKSRFFVVVFSHIQDKKELVLSAAEEGDIAVSRLRDGKIDFHRFFARKGAALFVAVLNGNDEVVSVEPVVFEQLPAAALTVLNQTCDFSSTASDYEFASAMFADVV